VDKIRIRFAFLSSSPEEREEGIVRMKIDQKYMNLLRSYGKEHLDELGDQMAVVEPWTFSYSTEAIRFFHQVRDMVLEKQSGPQAVRSKTEKDHLKTQLKQEFGPEDEDHLPRDEDGYPVLTSLKEYTREELWHLCQGAVDWLLEAGGSLEGLRIDFNELKENK